MDQIKNAIDLKEAASLIHELDPFTAHMAAPDTVELVDIEHKVDEEFAAQRPTHDKLEKLLSFKTSLQKTAHVEVTPEEEVWREELEDAVKAVEQGA